jgi:hypothetical protein
VSAEESGGKYEAYVQRALAARAKQGLPEGIEDPDTLSFLAGVLARAAEQESPKS